VAPTAGALAFKLAVPAVTEIVTAVVAEALRKTAPVLPHHTEITEVVTAAEREARLRAATMEAHLAAGHGFRPLAATLAVITVEARAVAGTTRELAALLAAGRAAVAQAAVALSDLVAQGIPATGKRC
jgi:hypothetical protein